MPAYLDTSALVSLIILDANTRQARAWFNHHSTTVQTSLFGKLEFASAISLKQRRGDFTGRDARFYLDVFDEWLGHNASIFDVVQDDYATAEQFVRQFDLKLRGPDALHLAICKRLKVQLVTFDQTQASAARALGLTVEIPS
jgi:uncharacterized protein